MIRSLLTMRKLLHAAREHHKVEAEVERLFATVLDCRYRREKESQQSILSYLQRNFFSSLFLSIYDAVGIPDQERIFYGVVNHCIRGIVTGTDNLLDNEYKELLPFAFPEKAIRFKSVMHVLCFDRILEMAVEQEIGSGRLSRKDQGMIRQEIFSAMVPIGAEEAMEEVGVSEIILPAEILQSVHMYKGGKLLCLAFVAPLLLERKARQAQLVRANEGIYKIGLALQVIDDITDLYEDSTAGNHNYLISAIYHEGTEEEQRILGRVLSGVASEQPAVEEVFQKSLQIVMARAIGEALAGFADLARAGYWFREKQALRIIRFLFQIRGVGHLLPFFPKPDDLARLEG